MVLPTGLAKWMAARNKSAAKPFQSSTVGAAPTVAAGKKLKKSSKKPKFNRQTKAKVITPAKPAPKARPVQPRSARVNYAQLRKG